MNRNTLQRGDFHTVFIKKQSKTDWTEIDVEELTKLTEQLHSYKKQCTQQAKNFSQSGVLNPHDLWDVLVLLDISVPPSALHFLQPPVVTFFTYGMIGREDVCPESCKFMKELLSNMCFEKVTKFNELKVANKTDKMLYTGAAFIGTYDGSRLHQKQCHKEAKKIDESLRLIHEQINASYDDLPFRVWYKRETSDNNSEDNFLHLVNINNCQGGRGQDRSSQDESIFAIKKDVNDSVRINPEYEIPFKWILLYFKILKLRFAANAEQCFVMHGEVLKMWRDELNGKDEELHLALDFFHHFGALFYFESLSEYVFTDCRWLIDGVRELISDDVEYSRRNHGAKKALKQEGLVKYEMLSELDFKVASGDIELNFFFNLLVELKYIARVDKHYFFPHILECHDHNEVSISKLYGSSYTDPLFITFSPGVLHPCTFCCLIAYVLTELKQWKKMKFKTTRHTFKDLITFSHGPHYISFVNETFHLKIHIFNKPGESDYDPNLPYNTLILIKRALKEVCKSLCLQFNTCKYGFLCSNCDEKSGKHMMMVDDEHSYTDKINACCCKTNEQKRLSRQQAAWFSRVSENAHLYNYVRMYTAVTIILCNLIQLEFENCQQCTVWLYNTVKLVYSGHLLAKIS